MIEVMFAIRKDKFTDHPSIPEGLDLINEDDQITHLISLDDELDGEDNISKRCVQLLLLLFIDTHDIILLLLFIDTHDITVVTIYRCIQG